MAERLHPGVYTEERNRNLAPIQGVSTSNYGTVGFSLKGPVDEATLVTTFEQFERTFGGFTEKGQMPTHLYAFFANGGRRAYVVRVVASDAVVADGFITSDESEELIATGDGATFDYSAATGSGPLSLTHLPIEETGTSPGSVAITYAPDGTPVSAGPLTYDTAPDGVAGVGAVTTNVFGITAGDDEIVPGTVTVNTLVSVGAITYVDTGKDGILLDASADARGRIDYLTGRVTLSYELTGSGGAADQVPDALSSPTMDYTPVGAIVTITDDGAGNLIGAALDAGGTIAPVPSATVDYTTGELDFILVSGTRATDDLTFGGIPVAAEIVTIGTTVYTFVVTPTLAFDVDIGISAAVSLDNLIAAINLTGTAGTEYGTGTTIHPDVAAAAGAGDTMDVEAKIGGTAGNSIITTTDVTLGVWSGAGTLSGGLDTTQAPPHDLEQVLAAYSALPFDVTPISAGAWGNDVSLQVRGNEDNFTRATATYALHDVLVLLEGTVEEIFTAVDLTDPTSNDYLITKINSPTGSSLITLEDPSDEDIAPDNLDGKAATYNGGAGNGIVVDFGSTGASDPDGFPAIPAPYQVANLPTTVQPTSVSIAYTDTAGTARTITDDGDGNLIGDVDSGAPAGSNSIDYDTGKFAFRVATAVSAAETTHGATPTTSVAGSLITISLYLEPASVLNTDTLSAGSDGVASIGRTQLTSPTLKTDRAGMYALLTTDELLNIGIPDAAGNVTMAVDQITEAETNGKWFIILATTAGLSPQGAKDYRRNSLGTSSSYAALYYPYITISDPVTDQGLNIPPIGHIAGVYARTDTTKSVGKAPAGTLDGRLNFSIGLERNLEFAEIDTFFGSQVNAIIDTAQTGRVVWGVRSLENPPGDFRFIHVRRLFNFLKASIFNSTHGFVFEDVGSALRARISLSVESFLRGLFGQGLFAGDTPQEAFTVICDETNNPAEVANAGEVICDIFVAPNTPGEFIVFRLQQKFATT